MRVLGQNQSGQHQHRSTATPFEEKDAPSGVLDCGQ